MQTKSLLKEKELSFKPEVKENGNSKRKKEVHVQYIKNFLVANRKLQHVYVIISTLIAGKYELARCNSLLFLTKKKRLQI